MSCWTENIFGVLLRRKYFAVILIYFVLFLEICDILGHSTDDSLTARNRDCFGRIVFYFSLLKGL